MYYNFKRGFCGVISLFYKFNICNFKGKKPLTITRWTQHSLRTPNINLNSPLATSYPSNLNSPHVTSPINLAQSANWCVRENIDSANYSLVCCLFILGACLYWGHVYTGGNLHKHYWLVGGVKSFWVFANFSQCSQIALISDEGAHLRGATQSTKQKRISRKVFKLKFVLHEANLNC